MKIEKNYNRKEIIDTLNMLDLTQKGNNILTKFDNRLIANTIVSNKYKLFDFSTFARNIVNEIENYFTPESFILKVTRGQQELRLIGESVLINGDKYSKMFNIFNSTDRTRALGINAGLIRFVCTNGMVIGVEDELSQLKVKHFKNSMPDKVQEFIKSLDHFNLNIQKQSDTLEQLNGGFVSFKELAGKLIVDKDGIVSANKAMKLRAFAQKLLNSDTDRLENLAKEQIELLNNPHLIDDFKKVDIEIPSYTALNCYTEVFRKYDSQVLSRETNRILELI
jgi:hypothetical protein